MTPPGPERVDGQDADEAASGARAVGAVQRRTLGLLVVTQMLGGLGVTVGIAVAAVLAERVSGSATFAGLVQTMQVLGAAAAAYLLARVMGVRGRRPGLALGYLLGAAGAALCVAGGATESFWLLLLGAFLLGANTAASLAARYAAADLSPPRRRGRDLSLVLWATTVGAVLGPNLVGPAGRLAGAVGVPRLTGPFLISLVVSLAAAALLVLRLRPDPLLLARELAGADGGAARSGSLRDVVALARERRPIAAAVTAMSSAHAVMIAVMVMTPLHMDHGGAALQVIGLVVSVHVLGMFAVAPVFGVLADRVGTGRLLAGGAGTLWLALLLAGTTPEGASLRIGLGLLLLGLGWSASTVAAAALLVAAAPLDRRTAVQGSADLVMNLAAATAGVLAGVIVGWAGFGALNVFAAVLVLGVVWAARQPQAGAATPTAVPVR